VNRLHRSFLTILFAPLVGVVCYLWLIGQFDNASLEWGFAFFVLIGWCIALGITAMIGVPLGLGLAHLMRGRCLESRMTYALAGTVLAASLPAAIGWWELVIPAAQTGLLLSLGYWQFEAKPRLTDA